MFSVTLMPSDNNSRLCTNLRSTLSENIYDYFDESSVQFWESNEEQIIFINKANQEAQWGVTINADNRVVLEEFLNNIQSPVPLELLEA
ncbi:hypothetical protein A9264_07120 [Vibrio sp. UCD-FRSSP16_10]|uniref:hypothetical protein n=1 Tax=unclassified Vibrio TaxID=2614977 RepID=UPI0008008DD4|nr:MULTISPECIES: hypothetical protein [unclassified Vibrio]OBT13432.1 hypothetical protein A9264_07120 [Vibrio sp. UCD-FRSSP16_10]OBT17942.1 hypothetical protein A9260_01110 [Vibrio sp. UCD-FRSSP16_30]